MRLGHHPLHRDGTLMIPHRPSSAKVLLLVQNHPMSNQKALHIQVLLLRCVSLQSKDVSSIISQYISFQG